VLGSEVRTHSSQPAIARQGRFIRTADAGYGTRACNDARRKLQADRVVKLLGAYALERDLVVVLGDFNDRPQSAALARLLGLKNLNDVIAQKFPDPKVRWTYRDRSQIDYLLASMSLGNALCDAGIERRGCSPHIS
jgi:endonuclease/exonuclease/phosphatase family metal-dependent hydrolase